MRIRQARMQRGEKVSLGSEEVAKEKRVYIPIGRGKYAAYKIVDQPYVSKVIVESLADGTQEERKLTELRSAREVVEATKRRMEDMHDAVWRIQRLKDRGII